VETPNSGVLSLFPGQTRPLTLHVGLNRTNTSVISFTIKCWIYPQDNGERVAYALDSKLKLTHKSRYEPHKITFKHPGGIVSYSMLRPPSPDAQCNKTAAPVLLQLHGAGVEADNDMTIHSLDSVPEICAFVLFPTGVTTWSGDDWRTC